MGDIVCELIAAGIEGGSKARIEAEWDLHDFQEQRSYWERRGPPLHVAVQIIGQVLGIDWKLGGDEAPAPQMAAGPSIAELAASGVKPL